MESVLNNQEKNIVSSEEVSEDLKKIEPLTEQGQSPAILTKIHCKTNEEDKSDLDKTREACEPNGVPSADNDKNSESDVIRTSNVLEHREGESKPVVAKPLLGFDSVDPITVDNSGGEKFESKETLEIPKQDEITADIDNQDKKSGCKETLDATKQGNSEPNVTEANTSENEKDEESESTGASESSKRKRNRLTGARKKRCKWLLEMGLSPEVARLLSTKSMVECRIAIANNDLPTPEPKKKPKISDEPKKESTASESPNENKKESNSEKPKRYAVLLNDYPDELLSSEQLPKIQSSIMDQIVTQRPDIKPKFLGTEFKDGYMIVTCANKATAIWLKRTMSNLKPWPGASLSAIPECDISSARSLAAAFPNSRKDSNEKILEFIGAQNEQLDIKQWEIRKRRYKGDGVIELFFLVDKESLEILKARDFKLNYKFEQVQMVPKGRLIKQEFATERPTRKRKRKGQLIPLQKKPIYEDARPQFERAPARFGRGERESSSRYSQYTAKVGHTSKANPSIFENRYY